MAASPIETVKGLGGGELPEFDTIDAANELIGALVMGFWNRLTRHQDRGAPFRLTRNDIPVTREGLACVKRGKIIHRWWKLLLCSGGYPPRDRLRPAHREQQGGWHFPPAPVE